MRQLLSILICNKLIFCVKDVAAATVSGNGTETGQIITTTIGGRDGQPKQVINYFSHYCCIFISSFESNNLRYCFPCLHSKQIINF